MHAAPYAPTQMTLPTLSLQVSDSLESLYPAAPEKTVCSFSSPVVTACSPGRDTLATGGGAAPKRGVPEAGAEPNSEGGAAAASLPPAGAEAGAASPDALAALLPAAKLKVGAAVEEKAKMLPLLPEAALAAPNENAALLLAPAADRQGRHMWKVWCSSFN